VNGFVQRVHRTITTFRLLKYREPVLVGISGGPDSVALTLALHRLRHPLHLLYVDHGLRPESAADGDFVEALAGRLGHPFTRVAVAPTGRDEASLRDARYAVFEAEGGGRAVATGHTASDQAETVLMRLLRGAGTAGLSAIAPRRGPYVRPLLKHTRSDVLAFLESEGQGWRHDETNDQADYLRNRVRSELMPLLERLAPGFEGRAARTAEALRVDREALESLGHGHLLLHGLSLAALRAVPEGLRVVILRLACPVAISHERHRALAGLVQRGDGVVELEGRVKATVRAGVICFEHAAN
jgi:tRNA(Ile)-lysidine synthase